MKKTALSVTLIICVVFSLLVIESQTIILVRGNAIFHYGDVQIVTPENKTYYSSPLTLSLSYHATFSSELEHRWIVYSLDGGPNVTIYDEYNNLESYKGSVTLSGLSSGSHVIFICSKKGSYVFGTGVSGGWYDASDIVYFTVDPVSPHLSVVSPENKTYNTASVPLDFTAYRLSDIQYSLDGRSNVSVVEETVLSVSDGFHSLVCCGTAVDGTPYVSEAVNFAVDTGPPEIEVLSIENKTYYTGDLPLSFVVSEPLVMMGYSLDGPRVDVDGNVSLNGLSWGSHFIRVYGFDSVSGTYVITSPIYFSIFPTGLVIASAVIIVIVVVVAVFLLMRKHKH